MVKRLKGNKETDEFVRLKTRKWLSNKVVDIESFIVHLINGNETNDTKK